MNHKFQLRNDGVRATISEYVYALPLKPVHEVIIKKYKKDRTVAQNSLYWMWLTLIAGEQGNTKDDVHLYYKKKCLIPILIADPDNSDFAEMIEAVRKVYKSGMKDEAKHLESQIVALTSTTRAKVKQMTEYLQDIEKDCISKGIVLPHPEDRYMEAMGK